MVITVMTGKMDPNPRFGSNITRQIAPQYQWGGDDTKQSTNSTSDISRPTYRQVPPVILIGVSKAGTAALLENMEMHPLVDFRRHPADPEHCYFSLNPEKHDDWYRRYIGLRVTKVTIDQCLGYLDDKNVPQRIYDFDNATKLLIILREPVARTISQYTQYVAQNIENNQTYRTFEELVFKKLNRLNGGFSHTAHEACYRETLLKWFDLFPREQIHIVDGGRFATDPYEELRKLEIFLHVRPYFHRDMFAFNKNRGFYCFVRPNGHKKCMRSSKGRKHLEISNNTRIKLDSFFMGCNKDLRILTGETFSWMK